MRLAFVVVLSVLLAGISWSVSSNEGSLTAHPSSFMTFSTSYDSMLRWLCDGEVNCIDPTTAPVSALKEKFVLRFAQSLWDLTPQLLQHPAHQAPQHAASAKKLLSLMSHPRPKTAHEAAKAFHAEKLVGTEESKYQYFGFLPHMIGAVIPGGASLIYSTECFTNVAASVWWKDADHLTVQINASGQISFLCTDHMFLDALGGGLSIGIIDASGSYSFDLNVTTGVDSPSLDWLLKNRGVRIGRFRKSILDCILDIVPTVSLVMTFEDARITKEGLNQNLQFLREYVEFGSTMHPRQEWRTGGAAVAREFDPKDLQSGDALFVQRPDGLDPIIGWAEGNTPGHTTMIMHDDNGHPHVCESTAQDKYWPRNGIQCHKWEDWWPLAARAEFNVVHVPLSPEKRAQFNRTAAWEWFHKTEALDYGYSTMLVGWLDTATKNSPCIPPNFDTCFVPELMEIVAILIDRFMQNNVQNFFRQAFNHRIGTWPQNLTIPQTMEYAATKKGLTTFAHIYSIPEKDEWDYFTMRGTTPTIGKSQVCNVFVCNMWKHGGLYDGISRDINCGESTHFEMFSLDWFDKTKLGTGRPKICQVADPHNELCQLMGNYTFYLRPNFNSRSAYPWMGNFCPSRGPDYVRPPGC